jgi:ribonuclease HI
MSTETRFIVFCDGSCEPNPGPGGFAWIISDEHTVSEGGGREDPTTNNRMEIQAVISALLEIQGKSGAVKIYCDSNYVINGITKWVIDWQKNGWVTKSRDKTPVKNRDLWETLTGLVSSRSDADFAVEFEYVPAHNGVAGNERADEIAEAFRSQTPVQTESNAPRSAYPVDLSDLSPHPEKASPRYRPGWQRRNRKASKR